MRLLQNKCTLKELEATCMDLIVHPDIPFLGATPDGIVCDKGCTGLIEVKCPYSVRDITVDDACEERTDFFLSKKRDSFTFKQYHAHWYQVQGQLLATGAEFCDFITFTKLDLFVERIYPDSKTLEVLVDKLSEF